MNTNDNHAASAPVHRLVGQKLLNEDDAFKLIDYLQWHRRMSALSNEELIKELLKVAPLFGVLGDLIDLVVERLCPGILDKIASQDNQPTVINHVCGSADCGSAGADEVPNSPVREHASFAGTEGENSDAEHI